MATRNRQVLFVAIAVFAVAGLAIYTADFKPDALKNAFGTQAANSANASNASNSSNASNASSSH